MFIKIKVLSLSGIKNLDKIMGEKFEGFAIAILSLIVLGIFMAWPVQILWNGCLIQAVDGLNPITFWQALGINILCGVLFKNSSSSKN